MKKVWIFSIFALTLVSFFLVSCVVWNAIKDRYRPYEIVGKEGDWLLVKFTFDQPSANAVHLAGEFNSWTPANAQPSPGETIKVPIPMEKDPKTGYWTVIWKLKPGRYQYKYIIDYGVKWSEDPANPLKEPDGFGGYNSVVIVKEE